MNDFITNTITATTTPTKIADASEFDRTAHIFDDGVVGVFVGFTSGASAKIVGPGSTSVAITSFVLPAGQELWLSVASGSNDVSFIITK